MFVCPLITSFVPLMPVTFYMGVDCLQRADAADNETIRFFTTVVMLSLIVLGFFMINYPRFEANSVLCGLLTSRYWPRGRRVRNSLNRSYFAL